MTTTTTTLAERFRAVRALTESLCEGLETEDFVVQSMADVSPTKWHLAHTTWFWETFVLAPHADGYALHDPRYPFLFNSYYVQAGPRHCRAQRGYLSRPTVAEVFAYRAHVDAAMAAFLDGLDEDARRDVAETVEIGLHHEQQHQELMLTDLKHVFSVNPLRPAYRARAPSPRRPRPASLAALRGGVVEVGATGEGEHHARALPLRQRGPAPPPVCRGVRDRGPPCHGRRGRSVHRRRRLHAPRAVALDGLGDGAAPKAGTHPFYWEAMRTRRSAGSTTLAGRARSTRTSRPCT